MSLYQTCAEPLVRENSSRLVAIQWAEKNIEEMLTGLQHEYHQRQEAIGEELFDLVAGYGDFQGGARPSIRSEIQIIYPIVF